MMLMSRCGYHVIQDICKKREAMEFLSGALAGAMTKAVLAPLETIRSAVAYFMYFVYFFVSILLNIDVHIRNGFCFVA